MYVFVLLTQVCIVYLVESFWVLGQLLGVAHKRMRCRLQEDLGRM